jgi:hypothetical protein
VARWTNGLFRTCCQLPITVELCPLNTLSFGAAFEVLDKTLAESTWVNHMSGSFMVQLLELADVDTSRLDQNLKG